MLENKWAKKEAQKQKRTCKEGDHGDQTQQEQAEMNQSATRGGEIIERGERRGETGKYETIFLMNVRGTIQVSEKKDIGITEAAATKTPW